MKKFFLFALLLIPSCPWAQPAVIIDSLKNLLINNSLTETTRIDVLNELAFQTRSDLEISVVQARETLALSEKIGYKKGAGAAHVIIGHYYWAKQENEKSLKHALSALRIFEALNDKKGLMDTYLMMGVIYISLKEKPRAEAYINLALKLALELNSNEAIARAYNALGIVVSDIHDRSKELYFYLKALSYLQASDKYPVKVMVLCNIGEMYVTQDDNKKALEFFFEAIRIAKNLSDISGQSNAHVQIGKTYSRMGDMKKSEEHLLMGKQLAVQSGHKRDLLNAYMALIIVKTRAGNNLGAHEYQIKYYKAKDSIFRAEKAKEIAELEISYQTDKKEQTIRLLEQENKIKSLSRNLLFAGLAFVVLSGGIIFYFQRQKNRRNQHLLKKQEELNQKLLEADQLKSRFFANISHEFRTPLTLILSPIEEKLSSGDLTQKDKISFQSIRRGANRLLQLVNQILELSKLESGFMKLNAQPGDLHHFVTPILSLFNSMADANQVGYTKSMQVSGTTVLFDADKLEKILVNLLSNAFKFSPKGSAVHVNVITTEKEQSVGVTLEVRNQYLIPANTLSKIFEPFFQGEQSPQGMPGTGLGLPLVKELVKLHGGTIRVTSQESEGTLFTVNLTLEKVEGTAIAQPEITKNETLVSWEEPIEHDAPAGDKTRETILIVEDSADVRALVRQHLQRDYNIAEASTGEEGMALAQSQNIDLVVSDVMMPVMNGIELCHALKTNELTSHIPVVLLTARADHESKLEGLRTGADDYVTKPFNMQELLARVANLTEQRKKLIQKYRHSTTIQPHEITVTPLDERFIQKALAIVEENLDNTGFNVDKFSEGMGMSRMNLHRKLKSITGLATNEFIQDFRLKRAALLIEKKADTLAQIAYMVGFNDQSYFTKSFKKKFGKTPGEYAQQTA